MQFSVGVAGDRVASPSVSSAYSLLAASQAERKPKIGYGVNIICFCLYTPDKQTANSRRIPHFPSPLVIVDFFSRGLLDNPWSKVPPLPLLHAFIFTSHRVQH